MNSCGTGSGAVFRSTDGGSSWAPQAMPAEVAGHNIDLIAGTPDNVHVRLNSGGGAHFLIFDGKNWRVQGLSGANLDGPYGFCLLTPSEGYFVSCWGWGTWDGANWSYHGSQFDFCDVYGGVWATRNSSGNLQMYAAGANNNSNGIHIWKFDQGSQSFGSKFG